MASNRFGENIHIMCIYNNNFYPEYILLISLSSQLEKNNSVFFKKSKKDLNRYSKKIINDK